MFNYDYAWKNNKGIILLPESFRIDTTPKKELVMIKLKNIDANGNIRTRLKKSMIQTDADNNLIV